MSFSMNNHAPQALDACGGAKAIHAHLVATYPSLRVLRIFGSAAGTLGTSAPAVVIAYRAKTEDQHGTVVRVAPPAVEVQAAVQSRFPGVRFVMVPTVGSVHTSDRALSENFFGRVLRTMWGPRK